MSEEVWDGNQGTLSVYVSKAKDLPNLDKLDKQDVLLRLRIAHMTRESDTILGQVKRQFSNTTRNSKSHQS